MGLLRRKKVVKPTAKEQKRITTRLQRKYPQMYEPAVGKAEQRIFSRAAPTERKELERMVGKRLKRKYKGK